MYFLRPKGYIKMKKELEKLNNIWLNYELDKMKRQRKDGYLIMIILSVISAGLFIISLIF